MFMVKLGIILEDIELIQKLAAEFPTLRQTLQRFGLSVNDLKFIGSSDHGVAFGSGDKAVKITDDKSEAGAAASLVGKKLVGTNQIYYVGSFIKPIRYHDPEITDEKVPYYLIIQELVDTRLSADEIHAATLVSNWLDGNKKWPFDVEMVLAEILEEAEDGDEYVNKNVRRAIRSLLSSVNELYVQHGVKYLDVHPGNVGKNKEGKLVVFDLGVSETRMKPALATIESKSKIHPN